MDRETRAFAEQHFRDLGGQLYGGGGQAPSGVAFIKEPATFSYADFVKAFLLPNRPCVFSSAFTENWGSRRRWVTPEGKPDFEYLLQKYGPNKKGRGRHGVLQSGGHRERHLSRIFVDEQTLLEAQRDSSAEDLGDVFTLPVYFSSDWLNEFWDALDVDDYRFVYAGPPGTWSPFHADIFRSFSWSANICGRKKWLFFPPGQEEALRDCHGSLPYDVTSPKLLDTRLHPMLQHSSPPLEVTQEAGEVVFVPSGWHHQVHNLDDTISINHNWVNGCNLANMWHFLQQELRAVQQEVHEWRDSMPDWHHHCQVIMRSCSGINFEEFYHFLKVIAERRLLVLGQGSEAAQEENIGLGLGFQQAAFDVGRLAEVLASMVIHPDFQRVDTSTFSPGPEELLCQLQDAVAATTTL
ncbi:2-oxoglutarate and iron-dependent oxygenase JMJD4 isoform X3 [Ictidomys tridecemlineatus]